MSSKNFAQLVRDGKGEQIAGGLTEKALQNEDNAGVPLVHLFALYKQLHLIKGKLTSKLVTTTWGPGWTVAHTAAVAGNPAPLNEVLSKRRHILYWPDQHGQTPVHLAALHKSLDQFDVKPSHLTIRDNLFTTPMHYAALRGVLHQVADQLTAEMLLMINWNEESVLDVLTSTNQIIPPALANAIWEAEYISVPGKRTWKNVLEHLGIHH
jgi:hypothetical protein